MDERFLILAIREDRKNLRSAIMDERFLILAIREDRKNEL